MKRYTVGLEPEAQADFDDIYGWIARAAGLSVADAFTERLRNYCEKLDVTPLRARPRDDLMPGLRVVTFEKSVSIAYRVQNDRVDILRFAYRGRDLKRLFPD